MGNVGGTHVPPRRGLSELILRVGDVTRAVAFLRSFGGAMKRL